MKVVDAQEKAVLEEDFGEVVLPASVKVYYPILLIEGSELCTGFNIYNNDNVCPVICARSLS